MINYHNNISTFEAKWYMRRLDILNYSYVILIYSLTLNIDSFVSKGDTLNGISIHCSGNKGISLPFLPIEGIASEEVPPSSGMALGIFCPTKGISPHF